MLGRGAYRRAAACMACVLVLAFAQPGSAAANEKSAVVIIDSGTEDLFIESLVRTNAESELSSQGYRIVAGAEVGGETPKNLLACAGDLACSAKVMEGIRATFVVFISLRSDEKSGSANFKIVVRNYDVATGRALARTMRRCPECKEEVDLARFTAQLIVDLVKKSAGQDSPGQDSPDPGPSPDPDPIEPPKAVTGPIPVPLTVSPPPDSGSGPVDNASSPNHTLYYIGMGAGTVAVALGTYFVLIDGPVIENDLRQAEANDTLVTGFASLGIGVAAIGLSAWLWSRSRDERATRVSNMSKVPSDTLPSAIVPNAIVPTAGGAALVWSGGF